MTKKFVIIPADQRDLANQCWAIIDPDTGGDQTWVNCPELSPTGKGEPTHLLINTVTHMGDLQVPGYASMDRAIQVYKLLQGDVTIEDADTQTETEVLAKVGLKIIEQLVIAEP